MMKRFCLLAIFAVLSVSICFAQDDDTSGNLAERPQPAPAIPVLTLPAQAQPVPTKPDTDNVIKGSFPVRLVKALDSSKLTKGDTVVCETVTPIHSRSGLTIPTGAKVIGHVTQAEARSKGDSGSTLAIEFDKIEYAKGEDMPIKGTVQAVAPSLGNSYLDTTAGPPELAHASSGRGNSNGNSAPPTGSMQIGGPASGTPILAPTSQGVLGVEHLQMSSDGTLSSPSKEVKLEAGIQIMIRAEIELASR